MIKFFVRIYDRIKLELLYRKKLRKAKENDPYIYK
jgi:hypothetical protein